MLYRHTLEVLISLAKTFSGHFLPWKDPSGAATAPKEAPEPASKEAKKQSKSNSDFWDTLLKLDQLSSSKKGKSVARSHSSVSSLKEASEAETEAGVDLNFENSPFGHLLGMLSSPVIRRNSVLTDKLLRLLSLISLGQPDLLKKKDSDLEKTASTASNTASNVIPPEHLKLAVEVLTSKTCSEEGLEDVTALLLNLSYGPEPTRDTILALLLQGAQELGNVVRQNILDLQNELRGLKNAEEAGDDAAKDTIGKLAFSAKIQSSYFPFYFYV